MMGTGTPKEITEQYLCKLYEDQQGVSIEKVNNIVPKVQEGERPARDMRTSFVNRTSLRNDIELFEFSEKAPSFGKGGVAIDRVQFTDEDGRVIAWMIGGEQVQLHIQCHAYESIFSPIIGFMVKDRLGQVIFADNTYLSSMHAPLSVMPGEKILARFDFVMPVLPVGHYTVSVAVAEGSQSEHVQHHWMHDALSFKVHSTSVCHGLIGVPMSKIELIKR
jgi:lipopolysaccharide transport system ATP-binding protein